MAERGIYQPQRGASLLSIPQVQASDAPAQLFGAIGGAAAQIGEQYTNHVKADRIRMVNNAISDTEVSLAEYVAKSPDDPTVNDMMQHHINAKYAELAKHDRDGAEQYRLASDSFRRLNMIDVNKNYNLRVEGEQKGAFDMSRENTIGLTSPQNFSTPEGQAAWAASYNDSYAMIYARKPDGSPTFTPQEQVQRLQMLNQHVADAFVRSAIAAASPDELAAMEQGMAARTTKVSPFEDVGQETELYKIVGAQQMDLYRNMIQERQREIKTDAERVSGRERWDAEKAVKADLINVANDPYSLPTSTPEQRNIVFGKDGTDVFDAQYLESRERGAARKAGFITPESKYNPASVDLTLVENYQEGFSAAKRAIEQDPAAAMSEIYPEVKQAANKGSVAEYLNQLDYAYQLHGVPVEKRFLLPEPAMNGIVASISAPNQDGTPATASQKAMRIQQAAAPYTGEYQERFMAQMFDKGRMDGMYNVMLDIQSPQLASSLAAAIDNREAIEAAPSVKANKKEIDAAVASQESLKYLAASLPQDDAYKGAWYQNAAALLTKQFVMQGESVDSAAQKAAAAVAPYTFDGIDHLVRIPSDVYSADMGYALTPAAMSTYLKDESIDFGSAYSGRMTSEQARMQYIESLPESARFVTSGDGKGVNIVDSQIMNGKGNTIMVREHDGKLHPWFMSWQALAMDGIRFRNSARKSQMIEEQMQQGPAL